MELRTAIQCKECVILDEQNINWLNYNKHVLEDPINWHKFLILDVHGLKRNTVLKALLNHIKPLELIPLGYAEEAKGASFFARFCTETVAKLCKDRFLIPAPNNQQFKLKILLKYSTTDQIKVNLSANVTVVLKKRFKSPVLNLSRFSEDPDLTEFFVLAQPRQLAFVLNAARILKPKVLSFANNEIQCLDALRILPAGSISGLDLRHNLIVDLAELKHLEQFDIKELWLEGNPLCELYNEHNYAQQVIQYCPKIEKLDGFLLRQNGVPSFRRNYLCDISAHDIVDRFLEDYFTTYDSKNLAKVALFYHEEALFSITTPNSNLSNYSIYSRNLRILLNLHQKTSSNLWKGRNEIIALFHNLPWSEHDPYSFTVDVLQFSRKGAVIVVTGVFRELPNIRKVLGFNRYFVLRGTESGYCIINEQVHIFDALRSQKVTAFKKTGVLQEARNEVQQKLMVETFIMITNLTKDYAKTFLEECQYNLKHAILLFVELYKCDKIPEQGFENNAT